jgi:hypothetical protein
MEQKVAIHFHERVLRRQQDEVCIGLTERGDVETNRRHLTGDGEATLFGSHSDENLGAKFGF